LPKISKKKTDFKSLNRENATLKEGLQGIDATKHILEERNQKLKAQLKHSSDEADQHSQTHTLRTQKELARTELDLKKHQEMIQALEFTISTKSEEIERN
jgi:hypothetical protein